jgi:hypothetical protein
MGTLQFQFNGVMGVIASVRQTLNTDAVCPLSSSKLKPDAQHVFTLVEIIQIGWNLIRL